MYELWFSRQLGLLLGLYLPAREQKIHSRAERLLILRGWLYRGSLRAKWMFDDGANCPLLSRL